MNAKLMKCGRHNLYIYPDDIQGKEAALSLCQKDGYQFYPGAKEIGKTIVTECFNGKLLRKEKLSQDAVCTVSKAVYESLSLSELPYQSLNAGQSYQGNSYSPGPNIKLINSSPKPTQSSIKDNKLVFIAGRGIDSKANYERLKRLAEKFGAGTGCSRPVAMNGWESYDNCVGISGNILEADTVLCLGVSGTEPFIKGIENCKTVIAVNKDKNAMIFKKADYGIIDECINVISYLENL